MNYQQPNSSNNSNANARNFRLENTLQTLRNMIQNMQKQEQMGVPVDPAEKQLYANIGKELKALQGLDDMDFNLKGSVLVRKITGQAPFPSNTPFNQNPYAQQQTTVNGYTDPFANAQPSGYQQAPQQPQQPQQGFNPNMGAAQGTGAGAQGIPDMSNVPFNPLGNFKKFGQGMGPKNQAFTNYVSKLLANSGLTNDYLLLGAEVAEILVDEHQFPMDAACEAGADSMVMIAKEGVKPDEVIGMRVIKGIASNGYGSYTPFGAPGNKTPQQIFDEILNEGKNQNNNGTDGGTGFGF